MPTTLEARRWLDRWDRQQELYVADREERFTVIADVVGAAAQRPDPLIVDLGAGPGSLSVRLLNQFPAAEVLAVDADQLLLGLARAGYADVAGLRVVEQDLRADGWGAELRLPRGADAVVSTTALHWLTREQLGSVYRQAAALLRPGGVLVNGDHFADLPEHPALDRLARVVRDARAARVGVLENEDWEAWWQAVGDAPELAPLVAERGARPIDHTVPDAPTLDDHARLLREAGFAEVGPVWQHGDDRVLVGVR